MLLLLRQPHVSYDERYFRTSLLEGIAFIAFTLGSQGEGLLAFHLSWCFLQVNLMNSEKPEDTYASVAEMVGVFVVLIVCRVFLAPIFYRLSKDENVMLMVDLKLLCYWKGK
jgi:hypothetical protein